MSRLLCAALLLLGASCKPSAPALAAEVRLGFITGLGGITEPCGCTSDPLGGLDRMAARVEQLRAEGPFELFVVGNTFFEHADPPGHLIDQERSKAEAIGRLLAVLKPRGILVGPDDLGGQRDVLGELAKRHGLPVYQPPRTEELRGRPDSQLITLGGVRIGVLGVPGAPTGEQMSYMAGAVELKAQGADFVVALWGGDAAKGADYAKQIRGMNVVVTGGSSKEGDVQLVDGKLVLDAGDDGRFLGVLRLIPGFGADASKEARRDWRFDDEGKTGRRQLQARRDRLRQDLERMEAGEARQARALKLAEIETELAAPVPPRPAGSYVTWSVERIDKKLIGPPWAKDILAAYNRGLCAIATAATAELPCRGPERPQEAYAGTAECSRCHPDDRAVYDQTKHAHAWATLTAAGKECDLGCISCHTVGYDQPGGFCRLADAAANQNVGCESCHGPGAGHAAAPFAKGERGARFVAKPSDDVCRGCHNPQHSDQFDFATYLPKVLGPGHGRPLTPDARAAAAPAK